MPVDDRLRRGLRANATAFDPEVETSLRVVRRRARRAVRARMARVGGLGLTAAAAVALVALAVRLEAPADRSPTPPVSVPSATAGLFSRYVAVVATPQRLAGHWTLELHGNGSALVIPPHGYAGVVSGTIFTADRTRLRINLFAQDVCADQGDGEYTWTRTSDRLVLVAGKDPCEARVRFFSDNQWVKVSAP